MAVRPYINGSDELLDFLLDRLGEELLREVLPADHDRDLRDYAGPMVALVRECYKAIISEDLIAVAVEHRARYMRKYQRMRRQDPVVAARLAAQQKERRELMREIVRERDRALYAKNSSQILGRREERRRQEALGELYKIHTLKDEGSE